MASLDLSLSFRSFSHSGTVIAVAQISQLSLRKFPLFFRSSGWLFMQKLASS